MLNRLVRWTARGLEYEADPRQCERLVKDLKLAGAKSVVTPGVKVSLQQLGEDEPLEASKHSLLPRCGGESELRVGRPARHTVRR